MTKSRFDKIPLKVNGLDRRISVAPMMDWTDEVDLSRQINRLAALRKRRSYSVAVKIK